MIASQMESSDVARPPLAMLAPARERPRTSRIGRVQELLLMIIASVVLLGLFFATAYGVLRFSICILAAFPLIKVCVVWIMMCLAFLVVYVAKTAATVALSDRICSLLGWEPSFTLEMMLRVYGNIILIDSAGYLKDSVVAMMNLIFPDQPLDG